MCTLTRQPFNMASVSDAFYQPIKSALRFPGHANELAICVNWGFCFAHRAVTVPKSLPNNLGCDLRVNSEEHGNTDSWSRVIIKDSDYKKSCQLSRAFINTGWQISWQRTHTCLDTPMGLDKSQTSHISGPCCVKDIWSHLGTGLVHAARASPTADWP